jgi:predicted nucleic acid-binding protein
LTLYVESSAIVAWLLDQPGGWPAYDDIRTADMVFTSELTMIECDRALYRHQALGRVSEDLVATLQGELATVASAWLLQPISPEIVARARDRFPDDRIRSLDAIHLASALSARSRFEDLALVTLDDRVRAVGSRLGFRMLPA